MNLIAAEQVQQATKLLRDEGGAERSAVFDFTLGNLCFQQEQLEAAAAAYKLAVEKFPKFRRAHRNLGIIHVRQGNYAEAVRPLARVIELGGGDGVTYGLLGFAYGNIDNHLAAEFAYRQAYLLDPATLDWRLGLARSYFKQKRFAEAVSLCGNLIDEHPGRTDFWLLQANAYLGLQQPLAAAKNYEMVDKLGQSTTETLGMLGDIYINEELPELAVAAHLRALELDRAPTRALRAAKALVARNSLTATRTLLERIEALHGSRLAATERKELLKLRARLAVAEGAGDEEAKVLEEIVALDPLDGEALILLGQQKVRAGEPERAVFYFERAAGIEAFEADAKVRHAQLLVAQGRYDEALPMLRRAQALQPRDHIQSYLEQVERVAQARK
jgi:tetratricopeptide (TPR) repeat protein